MTSPYRGILASLFAVWFMVLSLGNCKESEDSESVFEQGILECTFAYRGKNKSANAEDMSQYSVKLTAPKKLTGHVYSMGRAKHGNWARISGSTVSLEFSKNEPRRLKIRGKWPNKQYYKLIIELDSGEQYSTTVYFKNNREFRKVERPENKPEKEKEKDEAQTGTNWTIVVILGLMVIFFILLCYCAYAYYPSSYK